jgi:hypothetical protein
VRARAFRSVSIVLSASTVRVQKAKLSPMKLSGIWQLVGLLLVTTFPAFAQLRDVEITVNRNKLDEQKKRASYETLTAMQIAYDVKVRNKTFRDLENIEIKYMIFYEEAMHGSREKPALSYVKGKEAVGLLESHSEVSFLTTPVTLTKSELDGNAYWASGASNRSKDAIKALWFRAYADGKLVGEYVNPSTITKKAEWKE